jgi:hypothetical protein
MLRRTVLLTLPWLAACDLLTPSHVEVPDIQEAMAVERYNVVCVGLDMKADDTRKFATEKLIDVEDPIAEECICSHIADKDKGWDMAVADGMKTTDRDELAKCFTELVRNPALPKRGEAIGFLKSMPAPVARQTLADIAGDPQSTADDRVKALGAIAGSKSFADVMVALVESETDTDVRAAATAGLGGLKDRPIIKLLRTKATDDPEGAVRSAALRALKQSKVPDSTEMMCKAMMEDDSPAVRIQAIGAFRGTKRAAAVKCLRERALTEEADSGVRQKLLDVLGSSPHKDAPTILCDAIPFWARTYLKEGMPDRVAGTDIITAQNNRDFERSYECVQKAIRSSRGYSCYARAYTGHWMRKLGGTASVPRCPGYDYE